MSSYKMASIHQNLHLLLLATLISSSSTVAAFLFSTNNALAPNPSLKEYAQASEGKPFQVYLDVAQDVGIQSHLCIDGLEIEFSTKSAISSRQKQSKPTSPLSSTVPLPGSNGPYAHISTGPLSLLTHKLGKFISMKGQQIVPFQRACWEMIWLEDRSVGSIICGFHLPTQMERNDATLPKGEIYLNFNVWTKQGLLNTRVQKAKVDSELATHMSMQKQALDKCNGTKNLIQKAIYFREATVENEHVTMKRHTSERYADVPMDDADVIEMGEGLFLCRRGTIWRKAGGGSEREGKEFHGRVQQMLLGHAKIKEC